jgi:hypothetical protein
VHNWNGNFYNISWSGNDIAVQQAPDSGHFSNNSQATTLNDGGGNETRPINVYVYYLIKATTS